MMLCDCRCKKTVRATLGAFLFFLAAASSSAVNLVEEFYLPVPEWQVLQACHAITPGVTDTNFTSITSILVTGNGTEIYYDQWEDGYEANLNSPAQATTQILGDGINSNGICPGFTNDPAGLPAGTVIILTNTVPSSPRNPAQLFYDGRDRIGATKALVVTRAGWPAPTGPVFGGSAVVQPTIDWGTNYSSPIGQDMPENLFKYEGLFAMASENGTTVTFDPDGGGPLLPTSVTLNQGESYLYTGNVRRGATVISTKPVEVNLICGDTVSAYAIDWFTLYAQQSWSDTYYNPVGSVNLGGTLYPTFVYFYNNNSNPLTIFYTNLFGAGNFSVPVHGGFKYQMPTNSGAAFISAGGTPFTTLATVASSPSNAPASSQDTAYNWGFTPLPKGSLTTEADVGWAPGSSDFTGNGSPIWVTPTAATRVYVDYHGDHAGPLTDPNGNKYDTNFDLVALQSRTIYVPGTNDQTGLRVYTLDGTLLSVAWGEDPAVALSGNPFLDLGNPVLPFPLPRLLKSSVILTDAPPAGLSVGDTLQYTLQIDNKGLLPLGNTIVQDAPPPALNYLTNSTTLNGAAIPDSASGTAFPLDTPGYTIPIILSEGTSVIQYKAVVVAAGSIINSASLNGTGITVTNNVAAVAANPSLLVSKTLLSPANGIAGISQTMQFNLQIINNGNVPLANVALADNFPSNKFSFVSASLAPNSVTNGIITWTNLGNFPIGFATNLTVSLLATNTVAAATNFATATAPGSTTNTGSVSFVINAQPTAALTVNKTILSPATGPAGVGQTIQYNLQVYNNGFANLTNLTVTDNFPGTNFIFVTASLAPNVTNAASLLWTNLGSFAPGQITNITATFLVTNYSATVSNAAIAAAVGGVTNSGGVSLALSRSGLTITKTVLSPTNFPVPLGSNIVFRIQIKNSGQNTITRLPIEDTFGAGYFQYLSATIAPNTIAAGDLIWTNLALPPLLTNATITIDVTMRVTGGATPALNTASANFAYDINNAAVAPASGSVAVNTAAAKISGNVYYDADQNGILSAGDSALPNVTLSLYTDPNGDGNPADGTLAQTIISDNAGAYELLNLSTGAYVLVQSVLPGYTGSAPALNRIAINVTSLTPFTNNNFFQYPTPAITYATVNGTVWNDLAGDGIFHAGDFGLTNVQLDLISDLNSNGVVDAGETIVQTVFTATNGAYNFAAVTPGRYVIRETDLPGYISTGDARGANDNQIGILLGSGAVTNGNDFFDFYFGLANTNNPPVAFPDFASTLENVPLTIFVVTNDNSPGGFALTITNVVATNGIATNGGGTNVLFTPAMNFAGTATIGYTVTNVNGKATTLITVTVIPVADISILKTGPATVLAASNFSYTLTISNAGPATANNISVTDAIPANAIFVSASGNGTLNAGVVTWTIPSLAASQSSNLILTVTAPANGSLTNSASVGTTTTETNFTNNSTPPVITSVTPVANLAVGKSGVAASTLNSNFTYTISVTNFGPSIAANFSVTDSLPAGIIFVSALPAATTNALNQVIWTNLGALVTNATTNLTLTVKAVARGIITNLATIGGPTLDTSPTNNSSSPVVTSITNRPPVAVNDSTSTTENVGVTIPVLTNDSDPDGDTLTIISITPTNGTANISGTNIIFVPATNFTGTATVGYTIIDGFGGTNSALVTILVTNIPPLANPDNYSVAQNTTNNLLLPLANDLARTPGGILSLVSLVPTNGTATISGTNVLFTPVSNFTGIAAIGYVITDSVGGTNGSLITINVTNRPPVAQNDFASTPMNTAVTIPALANDSDPDGNPLTIVSVAPTNGTVNISGTNIIFLPTTNFIGAAILGYTISDGFGGTNSALVFISVTNRPPLALNDFASTPKNISVTILVLLNDSDPDNNPLTIASVAPTNGLAVISGTNVIFTPTNNFIGVATVGYTITDGFGGTNFALITISVTNRPPLATNDFANTLENVAVTIHVLTNDVDPDGDALTIVSIAPTNGTANISGTNIIFVPATNFIGMATIGYTISDGFGGSNSALVIIAIANLPPLTNPDFYSVTENSANNLLLPLANDAVQTSGGVLSLAGLTSTNGTAVISGTNILFSPATNFIGTVTIDYVVTDNIGGTNNSIVVITVTNIPPLANPDNYSVAENSANNLLLPLANDVVRTPGGILNLVSLAPTNGTAVISGTNVLFTPATNFLGTATIGYVITDGLGGTNSSLITINVTNRPPLAVNDFTTTGVNLPVTISPLVNDFDPDGNPLTLVSDAPTNGTAVISGTNILFTPATNFIGTAFVNYSITDGNGGSNSALVTITVTNIIFVPTANAQSISTPENIAKTITLTGSDPNNHALTFSIVSNPTNGVLSGVNTNTGALVYTPSTNYAGADTFTFRVNNGQTNSVVAAVSITVVPVADLAVTKSGPVNGLAGSNLLYTITLTNRGPASATNIVVSDALPNGFTFVSASSGGAVSNNFVNWNFSSLAAGRGTNLTITAYSLEGGVFTNLAFASSATTDLNATNNNGSLTNAQVRTSVSALADLQIFKTGGTNVLAGATVLYTITATNAGPSTASNAVVQDKLPGGATFQSASGSYSLSNNVVTWTGTNLARGASVDFTVTLVAGAMSNSFVNVAMGTSPTPDPVATNNNGSALKSKVSTHITAAADVAVLMFGPSNVVVGGSFTYTIVVTNMGPSSASNVVLVDIVPFNLNFVSASGGGVLSNGVVTWPKVPKLAVGGATNYLLTVSVPGAGAFTNIAASTSTTADPNVTNNDGSLPVSRVQTVAAVSQFNWLQGAPLFNPQTGLYEESVVVTNLGATTVAGVRLYVGGLRSGVSLWNAGGTNNGVAFVQYNFPLNPSNTVTFALEFYNPSRLAFSNTVSAVAILPPNMGGTGTNGSIAITKIFTDTRIAGDTRYVIEFPTVPGKTYTIIYSDDFVTWKVATPSVLANANVTQWYDDGPPKTDSRSANRYYRVIQN